MTSLRGPAGGVPPLESIPVAVVVERRKIEDKWRDHEWHAVDLLVGAPPATEWRKLIEGDGWIRYLTPPLELGLYRDETEDYRINLTAERPYVYAILQPDEDFDSPHEVKVAHVTVSPFEAGSYGQSGDEIIDSVPMPREVAEWIATFVGTYHVERPFYKRQQNKARPDKTGFGRGGPRTERTK